MGHGDGLIIVGAGADDHVADKTHQGPVQWPQDLPLVDENWGFHRDSNYQDIPNFYLDMNYRNCNDYTLGNDMNYGN